VTVEGVTMIGDEADDFPEDGGSCAPPVVLPRRGRCGISISFAPTEPGPRTTVLEITVDGEAETEKPLGASA
jgi:hypothetical protein